MKSPIATAAATILLMAEPWLRSITKKISVAAAAVQRIDFKPLPSLPSSS